MNENKQGDERSASTNRWSRIRALALLWAAAAVFFSAVILCIHLIIQSAGVAQYPIQGANPLDYEVHSPVQTEPSTSTTEEDNTSESGEAPFALEAPVSVNDSTRINILLLGVEGDKNDTLIIAGVDTMARTVSFLSIPRDTYISGDYDLPKAKQIYGAFDADRRIAAVKEAVKDMFGFWVDYYFVLDEATLSAMVSFTDGVEYSIPKNPSYHSLSSGEQTITAENAFALFRFKESWTDVETDPPRVQRYFLQALFAELVQDKESIEKNSLALSEIAKTDLTAGQMAYLAHLLAEFDFENAFSRALPGGEVEIEDVPYYEVNIEQAVEMLNEQFNPLEKDLTVYNVHFRQEQGASGEGEYSEYGSSTSTTTKNKDTEKTEDDPDNTEETEDDPDNTEETEDDTDNTEETESTDETDPTETETSETEPEVTDSDSEE